MRFALGCIAATTIAKPCRADEAQRPAGTVPSPTEGAPTDAAGLRFEAGLHTIVHGRMASSDRSSFTYLAAPALGVVYRTKGAWDLHGDLSLGLGPRSVYGGAAIGARAFMAPESSLSLYFDLGIKAFLLLFDSHVLPTPAGHVGIGVEGFHRDRHGRLGLDFGVDVPVFPASGGAYTGWEPPRLYIVPLVLSSHWTF